MDFALSPAAQDACSRMWDLMRECVIPAEPAYEKWRAGHGEHDHPPVMEDLKAVCAKLKANDTKPPASWPGLFQ